MTNDDNKNKENDSQRSSTEINIDEILADLNTKRNGATQSDVNNLQPPKPSVREVIDFAKSPTDDESEALNVKKAKRSKKTKMSKEKKERKSLSLVFKSFGKKVITAIKKINIKKLLISIVAVICVIAVCVGVNYSLKQRETAYLKPFIEKYPDIDFPSGILESMCEYYANDTTTLGYISISDIEFESTVSSDNTKAVSAKNCSTDYQFNYVVYMDDTSLEEKFSTAQGYNDSYGYITYSTLYNEYNFKVIGAFYTNTKTKDDDGYIFPYDVTEKMTNTSFNQYTDRLYTRFLYDTQTTITSGDVLLTISCPTDFHDDFRFVIVCVARTSTDTKKEASDNDKIHFPQVIYDENEEENPYSLASKWYPEIILDEAGEQTKQLSVEDFK